MKLTPAQFRDTLGISQETLRHWRKVLPIFHGHNGYAPTFTSGDLLAGAVVKLMKKQWGISVTAFAEQSIALGKVCGEKPWAALALGSLQLSLADKSCIFVPASNRQTMDQPCLVVPLGPIVDHLTTTLLQDEDRSQSPIYFPLADVGRKANSA